MMGEENELVPTKDRQSKRGSILPVLASIDDTNLVGSFDADMWEILIYRTHAIITRGLYIFYPIFQCGL